MNALHLIESRPDVFDIRVDGLQLEVYAKKLDSEYVIRSFFGEGYMHTEIYTDIYLLGDLDEFQFFVDCVNAIIMLSDGI